MSGARVSALVRKLESQGTVTRQRRGKAVLVTIRQDSPVGRAVLDATEALRTSGQDPRRLLADDRVVRVLRALTTGPSSVADLAATTRIARGALEAVLGRLASDPLRVVAWRRQSPEPVR